jgi:hypothetical protein
MIPYGHTTKHLENHDEADEIAGKAVAKLAERYGTFYRHGNTAETICNLDNFFEINNL